MQAYVQPEMVLCVSKISNRFDLLSEFTKCQLDMLLRSDITWVTRSCAEQDESFLQIIPYFSLVSCRHDSNGEYIQANRICSYRRSKLASEKRLHGKKSIGFGGHINPCDGSTLTEAIANCMFRELHEEVIIGNGLFLFPHMIGMIYDKSTPVGRVHLGVYFIIPVIETAIVTALDNEISELSFRSIDDMQKEVTESPDSFEAWSNIVLTKYWT